MKKELTSKIYCKVFDTKENHENINKLVKAVIVNFGDSRDDIVVKNDNFGTRRKYADFTNGKKEAERRDLSLQPRHGQSGSQCAIGACWAVR